MWYQHDMIKGILGIKWKYTIGKPHYVAQKQVKYNYNYKIKKIINSIYYD